MYVQRMIRRLEQRRSFALTHQKCRALSRYKPVLVILQLIFIVVSSLAIAEEATKTTTAKPQGIEYLLYLTIRADPASPLLTQASGQSVTAKFLVSVRISAHSQETNFFGVVPAIVSEFALAKGSNEQQIWRDGKCHHERGFPKITIKAVDGSVTSGQENHPVAARWRELGLILPRDEVQASKKLDKGHDNIGSYIATRTETKQSRLLLDMKLYTLPCDLPIAPQ